jgi:hypothetical protein
LRKWPRERIYTKRHHDFTESAVGTFSPVRTGAKGLGGVKVARTTERRVTTECLKRRYL